MEDLYGGLDPRNIPSYTFSDAARYLRIPSSTIRSWALGYRYSNKDKDNFFKPLISITASKPYLLSFTNLVEVHVLRAIRQNHHIQLNKVREALDFINDRYAVANPLARESFQTDGVDLFVERYGALINASQKGIIQLKQSFDTHLKRIEPDDSGLAIKLYPFTRSHEEDNPRLVVIDPRVAFGRLIIAQIGVATSVIKERYLAGDSISELAEDYNCSTEAIEEAIRCELGQAA